MSAVKPLPLNSYLDQLQSQDLNKAIPSIKKTSTKNVNNEIKELQSQLKFFNKIFSAHSIEQFLMILYKEINKRFKARSLVLCWNSGHYGPIQYICSDRNIYKKSPQTIWPAIQKSFRLGQIEDQQYLASQLGRPVQKTLVIPIYTKNYSSGRPYSLFIEFSPRKEEALTQFFKSFLSSLESRLDTLFLEDVMLVASELWTSTFNKLKEPLAIFDEQGNLTSSNIVFDKMFSQTDMDILQETLQWHDRTYEKHSYPANIQGAVYTICHYVDVTDSITLRGKMIQNTKMSALGNLGESIAHQLNNPLTGILSMAQIILHSSHNMSEQTLEDMKHIMTAVSRSQKIISNLLDFSRTDTQLDLCDLNQIVENTLPFLKSIIQLTEFDLQFCKQPVTVKIQPCLLQQVVFNLVKNSCQAIESLKQNKKIKIQVMQTETEAILSVEDNGQGIAEQDYENIFKLFFTTKKKEQGSGIGLTMSRRIVEGFKGKLSVGRSILGGACFTLRLPLQKDKNTSLGETLSL